MTPPVAEVEIDVPESSARKFVKDLLSNERIEGRGVAVIKPIPNTVTVDKRNPNVVKSHVYIENGTVTDEKTAQSIISTLVLSNWDTKKNLPKRPKTKDISVTKLWSDSEYIFVDRPGGWAGSNGSDRETVESVDPKYVSKLEKDVSEKKTKIAELDYQLKNIKEQLTQKRSQYELLLRTGKLGESEAAQLYAAEIEKLGQEVARLKIIAENSSDPEFVQQIKNSTATLETIILHQNEEIGKLSNEREAQDDREKKIIEIGKAKIAELRTNVAELRDTVEKQGLHIEEHKGKIAQQAVFLKDYERTIGEKAEELDKAKNDYNSLRESYQKIELKLQDLEAKKGGLEKQIEELKAQEKTPSAEQLEELRKLREENAHLYNELEELDERLKLYDSNPAIASLLPYVELVRRYAEELDFTDANLSQILDRSTKTLSQLLQEELADGAVLGKKLDTDIVSESWRHYLALLANEVERKDITKLDEQQIKDLLEIAKDLYENSESYKAMSKVKWDAEKWRAFKMQSDSGALPPEVAETFKEQLSAENMAKHLNISSEIKLLENSLESQELVSAIIDAVKTYRKDRVLAKEIEERRGANKPIQYRIEADENDANYLVHMYLPISNGLVNSKLGTELRHLLLEGPQGEFAAFRKNKTVELEKEQFESGVTRLTLTFPKAEFEAKQVSQYIKDLEQQLDEKQKDYDFYKLGYRVIGTVISRPGWDLEAKVKSAVKVLSEKEESAVALPIVPPTTPTTEIAKPVPPVSILSAATNYTDYQRAAIGKIGSDRLYGSPLTYIEFIETYNQKCAEAKVKPWDYGKDLPRVDYKVDAFYKAIEIAIMEGAKTRAEIEVKVKNIFPGKAHKYDFDNAFTRMKKEKGKPIIVTKNKQPFEYAIAPSRRIG